MLLVEDEALVAMMIQECLTEFGFQRHRSRSARCPRREAVAKDGHFDAAVLDINLGDGLVYQVAEILAARACRSSSSPATMPKASTAGSAKFPVLQKPIEREMLQKIFAAGARVSAPGSAARVG